MKQIHGGNLRQIARQCGVPEKEILDFSSNINPLGTPKPAIKAMLEEMESLIHYPEIQSLALREKLAEKDRIKVEHILAGNGSTEFIYLIPRVFQPGKVLILSPTFSDYERAFTLAGWSVARHTLRKDEGFVLDIDRYVESMQDGVDLALICNPNNPTGAMVSLEDMKKILSASRFTKTTIVIDEAFMDFVLGESMRFKVTEYENLLVLRSLTKFYGIPGLRAGCLYGSGKLIEQISAHQEPWTVNRLSQAAVIAALYDDDYRRQSLDIVRQEKEYLIKELGSIPGIHLFPSSANFLLLETSPPMPEPDRLFEALLRSGILVRNCASFENLGPQFIRIAVKNHEENMLLVEAVGKLVRKLE